MTVVTLDLRPDGDGCELTLTNEGVPPDYAARNQDCWSRILAGLLPARPPDIDHQARQL